MKQIKFVIAAFGLVLFITSCHRGNAIIINNGEGDLSIYYSGDIKFNDDETGIQSISPDGYVRYKKNGRKLVAESDYHGQIKYELDDNGRTLEINSQEGKRFLAVAIKDMIDVGFDAKGRMERLYNKGGNKAVLDEVNNLKSDYVKVMYLQFLLSSDSLNKDEVKLVLKKICTQIDSDFDKGNILNKIPTDYLKDSLVSSAWFEAVRTIGSDFEKSNALKYRIRQQFTNDQFDDMMDATSSLGSDFEKSNILKELINKSSYNENYLDKTLDAVNNIGSDFEKMNILKLLIEKDKPTGKNFDKILDVGDHVGSDFDKGNIIKQLIENGIPADASFDKLLSVINHLGSDFDKVNLLKDVANKNIQTEQQWIGIINCSAEINSDFDKSNLLVSISKNLPKNDNIKMAFTKAAKTINSEQEYGRVMKTME